MNNYLRYFAKAIKKEADKNKKVVKAKVKIKVKNVSGTFKFTDIMLQEGNSLTGYLVNSKEMITRTLDETQSVKKVKHYNVLCRGTGNAVIINNGGNVTTGLDFKVLAKNGTTGDINVETLYRTRKFQFNELLNTNSILHVDSFNYKVYKDDVETKGYSGSFLGMTAGFGMYNVEMANRDMGRFVFYIKEFDGKDRT